MLYDPAARRQDVTIKNRDRGPGLSAEAQVSTDFLQLVRFSLRSSADPRIRDSIVVADELLRVETPSEPSWHHYNGDVYGEHPDGIGIDGKGHGRASHVTP